MVIATVTQFTSQNSLLFFSPLEVLTKLEMRMLHMPAANRDRN